MTDTMNTGSNQPMSMATTGTSEPMGAMNNGGAKPMGMASTGDVQMNGGGPEPHQGSNPGAQSDPGPKEVGFYDKAVEHMGGDDGVQSAAGRPSPARMGGVDGSQPNPGQRGGQNTGTSGTQTTSYSSKEEYGAGSIPGVTGTHAPGHTGWRAATNAGSGAYQSRAAERLATADGGSKAVGARMGEPAEDFKSTPTARMGEPAEDVEPTPAARAGDMVEGAVEKAQGFFAKAKDAVEDFFSADIADGRGFNERTGGETYGGVSSDWSETPYERDTSSTRPYNAGSMKSTTAGSKNRSQGMEVRSTTRVEARQREKELTAA